jgi:hypothetical protein
MDESIVGNVIDYNKDLQLVKIKIKLTDEIKTMPISHFERYWAYFDKTLYEKNIRKTLTVDDFYDYIISVAEKHNMTIEPSDNRTVLMYVQRKDGTYSKPSAIMVKKFVNCVNVYTKQSYLNKDLIYNSRMAKVKDYYYDKVAKIINLNLSTEKFIDALFKQINYSFEEVVNNTPRKPHKAKARPMHKNKK